MMKLRRLGSALALLCVISLLFAAYEAYRLSHAREFNRRIVSAIDTAATQDSPEAEFARALSLSAHDDYEGAVRAYKELSRTSEGSLLQSVLYNLGNLHLREALKYGPDEIGRSLPLAELAKSSYRELLHLNPRGLHYSCKLSAAATAADVASISCVPAAATTGGI